MPSINSLESELNMLPDEIRLSTGLMLKQWDEQLATLNLHFQPPPELSASLVKVWSSSLFVAESCLRRPELLIDLASSGDLLSAYSESGYVNKLAQLTIDTEVQFELLGVI
jgi:glutamate-ammonia-ligase adenylyltransferase